MNNRKLVALSQELQGKSAADVDAILRQQHLDPQERLAVKVQLAAGAASDRRVQAGLATDRAQYRHEEADQRPRSEMQRLLDRVGVDPESAYTEVELGKLLDQAGITDTVQRLSIKVEAQARGLLATAPRDARAVERLLENLGVDGPVDQYALELDMDRAGYGVTAKNVVKAELQQRGWLKSSGSRSMRASAAIGTRLVDARGHSITLKSRL